MKIKKYITNIFITFITIILGFCVFSINTSAYSSTATDRMVALGYINGDNKIYLTTKFYNTYIPNKTCSLCYGQGRFFLGWISYPTCTSSGVMKTGCAMGLNAGYSPHWSDNVTIGAFGHSSNGVTKTKAATCTTAGYTYTNCTYCGAEIISSQIPAKGHSLTKTIIKAATCTEKGKTKYTCSCGYTYEAQDIAINASNHTGTEVAGGTSGVHSKYSCCGATKSITHSYSVDSGTQHAAATCTAPRYNYKQCSCGYNPKSASYTVSIGTALGHSYGTPTYSWNGTTSCTATRTCSRCSSKETENGTITNTVTKASTCTAKGERTYTATFTNTAFTKQTKKVEIEMLAHTPTKGGTQAAHQKCSTCGTTLSGTHTYTITTLNNATCTENGTRKHTCSCGYTYETQDIPATGHNSVTGGTKEAHTKCSICNTTLSTVHNLVETVIKKATCTEKGKTKYSCECGYNYELENIEALGHDYVSTVTNPTCTEKGYTTNTCSRCNDTYKSNEVTATGHSYGEYVTTKEATCTIDGSKQRTCSACQNIDTAVITKLGHDFAEEFTIDKEATCTIDGSKSIHCTKCSVTKDSTVIPATGHTEIFVGSETEHTKCSVCNETLLNKHNLIETVTKLPTCTTKGKTKYTCECSYSYELENIEALGHDYKATVTNATCTEKGYTTWKCSRCVDTYIDSEETALGHSFGEWTVIENANCVSTGSKERECNVCGYKEIENINALGHNFAEEFTIDKAPTCTTDGSKSIHCTRCEEVTNATTIPATGHILDFRNCINCNYVDPLILGNINKENEEVKLDVIICDNDKKEEVRDALNQNMILDSKKEVIEIVEFEDIEPDTPITLDLKYVSNEGDTVTLLDLDKDTNNCETIGTFNLKPDRTVTCEVSSSNSVIIIVPGELGEISATNNTTVYAEVGCEFKVTIPKHIVLNGTTKSGEYTVSCEGDIAGTDLIKVVPDNSFILKSTNLNDVTATISQQITEWKFDEILKDANKVIATGFIDAAGITAGSWNGNFNFNIKLETREEEYKDSTPSVDYNDMIYNK